MYFLLFNRNKKSNGTFQLAQQKKTLKKLGSRVSLVNSAKTARPQFYSFLDISDFLYYVVDIQIYLLLNEKNTAALLYFSRKHTEMPQRFNL